MYLGLAASLRLAFRRVQSGGLHHLLYASWPDRQRTAKSGQKVRGGGAGIDACPRRR